jgi:hypothetical protein
MKEENGAKKVNQVEKEAETLVDSEKQPAKEEEATAVETTTEEINKEEP